MHRAGISKHTQKYSHNLLLCLVTSLLLVLVGAPVSPFPADCLWRPCNHSVGRIIWQMTNVRWQNPSLTGGPFTDGFPQLQRCPGAGSPRSLQLSRERQSGHMNLSNQFILKISHSTNEKIFLTSILITTKLSAADLDSDISNVDSDKCLSNISSWCLECRLQVSSHDRLYQNILKKISENMKGGWGFSGQGNNVSRGHGWIHS